MMICDLYRSWLSIVEIRSTVCRINEIVPRTNSCGTPHIGYVIAGVMRWRYDTPTTTSWRTIISTTVTTNKHDETPFISA